VPLQVYDFERPPDRVAGTLTLTVEKFHRKVSAVLIQTINFTLRCLYSVIEVFFVFHQLSFTFVFVCVARFLAWLLPFLFKGDGLVECVAFEALTRRAREALAGYRRL